MIRKLYDWTMEKSQSPSSERWLAGIAFAESTFFPIPIDLMLIPMILANRLKAFRLATITLVSSLFGAVAGYAIGAFLFESVGKQILDFYGYGNKFTEFQGHYDEYGILIIIVAGITPIPFKVVTIASGVMSMNPLIFILAAVPARGVRFYAVALLLWKFGDPIRDFIEKRLALLLTLTLAIGVGGFVVVGYLGG